MKIIIGTRGSKLAMWQAHYVAERLTRGGFEPEIIKIETKGDKKQDVAIAEIGTRGVFTEEIEAHLQRGTIDMAVHSAKDMQSELPDLFELIAFTEREKVNDVLVSLRHDINLEDASRLWVVGTSSARRRALLQYYYPHVKLVEMRGNLQTRMGKLEAGVCDAILLAYAGVHRMEYTSHIVREFTIDQFTPAVGQGSIAIEATCYLDEDIREKIRQLVNHAETESRLLAERAFLRTLRGGCSVPVFALASLQQNNLELRGGVISLDGKAMIRDSVSGPASAAEQLGEQLAQRIIAQGGNAILDEIRKIQSAKN